MTLILLVSFLNKHCKKEDMHCRNYNNIIAKQIAQYNFLPKMYQLPTKFIISLDYAIRYYDTFSRIQRIQSINKHTEYDNLILEQHILSKKN